VAARLTKEDRDKALLVVCVHIVPILSIIVSICTKFCSIPRPFSGDYTQPTASASEIGQREALLFAVPDPRLLWKSANRSPLGCEPTVSG